MVGLHQSGDRIFHETPVHVSPTAENIQQKYQARESTIWQPVVQYIPQQTFINASPLSSLNMSSAPVDCPMCGARAVTRITFVAGSQTHVCGILLCLFIGLGCLPYIGTGTKDVEHRCGNCGVLLAKWHRSGATEVLAHTIAQPAQRSVT